MSGDMTAPSPELVQVADGVTISASVVGTGPVVLLNGGLGMSAGVWPVTTIPESLVNAGFSVITYTARGLKPSSAPPAPSTSTRDRWSSSTWRGGPRAHRCGCSV